MNCRNKFHTSVTEKEIERGGDRVKEKERGRKGGREGGREREKIEIENMFIVYRLSTRYNIYIIKNIIFSNMLRTLIYKHGIHNFLYRNSIANIKIGSNK